MTSYCEGKFNTPLFLFLYFYLNTRVQAQLIQANVNMLEVDSNVATGKMLTHVPHKYRKTFLNQISFLFV